MTMRHIKRLTLAAFVAGWMPAGPVLAGALDVTPYAGYGIAADSNVFRLTDKDQARRVTGGTQRSDVIQHQKLGVLAEWPMSRQRLKVAGQVTHFDYNRFDRLDHSENDIGAALEFEAGPVIHGTVSYQRSRELDDFSNRDSIRPDFIRRQQPEIEGYLDVTPDWRVHTSAGYLRLDHSLDSQRRFDRRESQGLLALQYQGVANSLFGLGAEYIDGDYPGRDSNDLLSPSFRQTTVFTDLDWDYSDVSTIRAQLGYTRRDNAGGGNRDFDGPTGRLQYIRTLTGKTTLSAAISRQIYSVDNVDANSLRQTEARLNLRWTYSPKLSLVAGLGRRKQDYQALPGAGGNTRRDRLDELSAELIYQPYRFLALLFNATGEHRESNRADESYDALVGGVALRIALDGDPLTFRP